MIDKRDYVIAGEVIENRTLETKKGTEYQEVVLETSDKPTEYPSPVPVQFWGDKIKVAQDIKIGDEVEISYNWRGRKWNDAYFVSLGGWKFDILRSTTPTAAEIKAAEEAMAEAAMDDDSGDLPF